MCYLGEDLVCEAGACDGWAGGWLCYLGEDLVCEAGSMRRLG